MKDKVIGLRLTTPVLRRLERVATRESNGLNPVIRRLLLRGLALEEAAHRKGLVGK